MNEKRLQGASETPERILIVKLSSLGDIIQSLPVASALRRRFPGVELTWIVNRRYTGLLELCPDIDRVIPFERRRWGNLLNLAGSIKEFRNFIKDIRDRDFDLVLDLQGLFRSGLITFLSKVPVRYGFSNAREGAWMFYNHRVEVPGERRHAVERYLTLAEHLGCGYGEPVFNVNPGPSKEKRPYIGINPGGRWPTKRWPVQRFTRLIDRLRERYGLDIVLIGNENDRETARDIANRAEARVTDLTGKTTLLQLAGILSACRVLITNDSGPMHLAGALGKPVVAMFGPTDPGLTGPWGSRHRILRSKLSCSPCFKKRCPLHRGNRDTVCMAEIEVEKVLTAVEDVLQNQKGMV